MKTNQKDGNHLPIPFSPPYIDENIIAEVTATLQSGWITTGTKVKELEEMMAGYVQVGHALAVNSATAAMMLCLHWYGVSAGDEVIIPAYTYCATALVVMHLGAKPVMVDVSADFTIDPEKIREAITEKTKAIITVDLGGWPCDYDAINQLVNENKIKEKFSPVNENQKKLGRILIMADAAHALGAMYKNKMIGACVDLTVFSLHAVKNVTSAEGGVICFNMPAPFDNNALYQQLRLWSLNGQTKDAFTKSTAGGWRYDIVYPGFKINMPDVLAAIAVAQLKIYDPQLLEERKRVFGTYYTFFKGKDEFILPPFTSEERKSSHHLFPLRIKDADEGKRAAIIEKITIKNVGVNVHFVPLPMLTLFKERGYDIVQFPVAYQLYVNEISLPIYPQLSESQCNRVCEVVLAAVKEIIAHG